jgi:hypothetical protein
MVIKMNDYLFEHYMKELINELKKLNNNIEYIIKGKDNGK